jgi:hypothetical protein
MTTSHSLLFCTAEVTNVLTIKAATEWNTSQQPIGLFVVQSDTDLAEGTDIQIRVGEALVWRGDLRPFPSEGVEHPFFTSGAASFYMTETIIRPEDLVVPQDMYTVQLLDDETILAELPLFVTSVSHEEELERLEQEEKEESAALQETDYIALSQESENIEEEAPTFYEETPEAKECEGDVEEMYEEEIDQEEQAIEEEVTQEEPVLVAVASSPNPAPVKRKIGIDYMFADRKEAGEEESKTEEAVENEDEAEESIPAFVWNQEKAGQWFSQIAAYPEFSVEVVNEASIYCPKEYFTILVEKIGNTYTTVVHEEDRRPFYVVDKGERVVEWEQSPAEYLGWVKNYIAKMYNIPTEEIDSWNTLLLTDLRTVSDEEKEAFTQCEDRRKLLSGLANEQAVVIDITPTETYLQLYFEESGILVKTTVPNTDIPAEARLQQVQLALELFEPASVYTVGLSAPLENSDAFGSLAWIYSRYNG